MGLFHFNPNPNKIMENINPKPIRIEVQKRPFTYDPDQVLSTAILGYVAYRLREYTIIEDFLPDHPNIVLVQFGTNRNYEGVIDRFFEMFPFQETDSIMIIKNGEIPVTFTDKLRKVKSLIYCKEHHAEWHEMIKVVADRYQEYIDSLDPEDFYS